MTRDDNQPPFLNDDLLWRQLKTIPAFRALLRAVESRFYQSIELPSPVLDVGCGDGHFAQMTFNRPIEAGIDPWWNPLKKAQRCGAYRLTLQTWGDHIPFPDGAFASAFSNSVLEHIPDIQPVLNEVSRVLQPNGRFVITLPSHHFTAFLGGAATFERLGLDGMAVRYRRLFNRISRHAHTEPPQVWAGWLAQAGFTIERWQYYFSREALRTLEIGHVQGVPSAILHALTGHWILGPWESSLAPTERWVRPYYEEPFPQEGAYMLIIARKVTDGPTTAELPPTNPFSLEELRTAAGEQPDETAPIEAITETAVVEPSAASTPPVPEATTPETEPASSRRSAYVAAGLLLTSLILALIGQMVMRAQPQDPTPGLPWFALSAGALALLVWQQRSGFALPRPHFPIPPVRSLLRRRWLYPLGILLAFIAQRLADPSGPQLTWAAFLFWLAAIGLSFYALYAPSANRKGIHLSRFTLVASLLLFVLALLPRLIDLRQHPFILTGSEASLGLNALDVLDGTLRNPFGTAWLTNPTLPLYLLALPLSWLGPGALAVRLPSALIGALTVVATYLIGQRLYGRAVGLVAGVLLLGSHFHVHFSRLGLTNVWDALLVLLALGLLAIAWQQDPQQSRGAWLLAGTAVGFNAYLFTSARLLPLMLIALLLLVLLTEHERLARNWWHVTAAAALALVIALPQLLHYTAAPGVFMERARAVGILDSQSGWLSREAALTGLSRSRLLWQQFQQAALAFNLTLDRSTSYGATRPLLSFWPGLLALMGFFLALFNWQRLRDNILSVWVLVTVIFAGALLLDPPTSHRLIVVAPALALLAGLALVGLLELLPPLRPQASQDQAQHTTRRQALLPVALLLATLLATADIHFYFTTYRTEHRFGDRNTEVADAMAAYLNTLEGNWQAYFYGPPNMYVDFPTLPFLVNKYQAGVNLIDVPTDSVGVPPAERPLTAYIALPERQHELTQVELAYPGGNRRAPDGYYATPLFIVYEVRP